MASCIASLDDLSKMATSELLNAYKRGNGNPQYAPAGEMLADIENDLLDG
ncbi:hypothetical protein BDD14_6269 [Edaphobacter modestus]|uniref:Uncharacterized protein n=1 Tax=Edaphobacter modestus TaxID=388466 RepID=A0A4Q7XZR8_9BACT|nr:hypothetical protein BDD14_6269 [Edaphobacter modestus]